jgi:inosine/xanthosine triphosphate pyrophosphatase family protein
MLNLKNVFISTSNLKKLTEFRRFGLPLEARIGPDLPEVQGTPEDVITYKVLAAGENVMVEDTSLDIEGRNAGINIRWMPESDEGAAVPLAAALWRVLIGVQQRGVLYIAKAEVPGVMISEPRGSGFRFDPFFVPNGYAMTLGELENLGRKDEISARKAAVENLMNGQYTTIMMSNIPVWQGSYQGEDAAALLARPTR